MTSTARTSVAADGDDDQMSRLADEYGLDVWIWYPAMDPDYGDPKTVEFRSRSGAKC